MTVTRGDMGENSAIIRAPRPPFRRLRTYAFDPSLTQFSTASINNATLKVRWEVDKDGSDVVEMGPVGEYVEVVDFDPATGAFYPPVDLNDAYLLAQDGLAPSEGNPQFHQQMVYAVVMNTISHFEHALGRVALWSPHRTPDNRFEYVPRLRIYPHALREANAFYDPDKKALLFGYFPASMTDPGNNLPGGMVFACLSQDIVAHETTHALLDGIHPRFIEPSNADALAFHEAFADIVALLQHFTYPEALSHQIAKTRGDLAKQNLLGELAQQFGQALGQYGALRDALGRVNPQTHQWEPHPADPSEYATTTEPHARGAILVAALFDGFLNIYEERVADLLRIATAGTGVLPEGDIHPDLVHRLAQEATKSAQHLLTMCIRALDYCPPVDLTFGDYLRALITADADLVPDDDRGYRLAVIEGFRRRGIFPTDVRTLAVDSLRWRSSDLDELPGFSELLTKLDLSWDQRTDRHEIFKAAQKNGALLHAWVMSDAILKPATPGAKACAEKMGLSMAPAKALPRTSTPEDELPKIEIHSVRPVRRVGPDGQLLVDLVIEMTQKRLELIDPNQADGPTFKFRGGSTLIIDLEKRRVRYAVLKRIASESRLQRQRAFLGNPSQQSLYATYFGDYCSSNGLKFLALHRGF
jgi:hypothetical protein